MVTEASCPAQTAEVYRKLRFTLRYLLGNLHDFEPSVHSTPYSQLPLVDRYMLSRLASVLQGAESAYAGYQFSRVFQVLLLSCCAGPA